MSLGELERLAKSGDLEYVSILPGDQSDDGTFTDVVAVCVTVDGEQIDIDIADSDLKSTKVKKQRLRRLASLFRRMGVDLLDSYGLVSSNAISTPDSPGGLG